MLVLPPLTFPSSSSPQTTQILGVAWPRASPDLTRCGRLRQANPISSAIAPIRAGSHPASELNQAPARAAQVGARHDEATTRSHREGTEPIFVDPIARGELRRSLVIEAPVTRVATASGRWLLVSTISGSHGYRLACWDLSRGAEETVATWLGEFYGDVCTPVVSICEIEFSDGIPELRVGSGIIEVNLCER